MIYLLITNKIGLRTCNCYSENKDLIQTLVNSNSCYEMHRLPTIDDLDLYLSENRTIKGYEFGELSEEDIVWLTKIQYSEQSNTFDIVEINTPTYYSEPIKSIIADSCELKYVSTDKIYNYIFFTENKLTTSVLDRLKGIQTLHLLGIETFNLKRIIKEHLLVIFPEYSIVR